MLYGPTWTKKLCAELTGHTGKHATARNIVAWSTDRAWLESIKDPDESMIFLAAFEIWTLVRFNAPQLAKVNA